MGLAVLGGGAAAADAGRSAGAERRGRRESEEVLPEQTKAKLSTVAVLAVSVLGNSAASEVLVREPLP